LLYFFHTKLHPLKGEVKSGAGNTQWAASKSTFVQTFLANNVADGTKTSIGFKKVHLNACDKAMNDHFMLNRTQITNHLKTMKKVHQNQLSKELECSFLG
jgi:3-methyladenine DNA glycosylase AlkC